MDNRGNKQGQHDKESPGENGIWFVEIWSSLARRGKGTSKKNERLNRKKNVVVGTLKI